MANLNCEACGGSLQMDRAANTAICLDCGKEFGVEDLVSVIADSNGALPISYEQAQQVIDTRICALRRKAETYLAAGEWSYSEELLNSIELFEPDDSSIYLMRVMLRHELSSEQELKSGIEEEDVKQWEVDGIRKCCDEATLARLGLTKESPSAEAPQDNTSDEDEAAIQLEKLAESIAILRERESARIGETLQKQQEELQLIAKNKEYTKAIRQLEGGLYQQAITSFAKLGDLFDSEAMGEKARSQLEQEIAKKKKAYGNASAKMKRGNYKEAAVAFKELGDFEDAPAQAREAQRKYDEQERARRQAEFDNAEQYMAAGRYAEARDIYKRLGSFGRAQSRLKDAEREIKAIENEKAYTAAEKLYEEKKFDQASEAFKKLGTYSDSKARASEAKRLHEEEMANSQHYRNAQDHVAAKRYKEAISEFEALGDYRDAIQLKSDAEEAYRKRRNGITIAAVIAVLVVIAIIALLVLL